MIEVICEVVVYLVYIYDGVRVVMYCLWYGMFKDRKVIVKIMKIYVEKVVNG